MSKKSRLDAEGNETISTKKVEIPLGYKKPETLAQMIARFVHSDRIQRELAEAGVETFEESQDFGPDDEEGPMSPHEEQYHGQFEIESYLESTQYEDDEKQRRPKNSSYARRRKPLPVKKEEVKKDDETKE